jgi:hypothetical protein
MELLSFGLSEDVSMMTVTRLWIFVAEVMNLAHCNLFYDRILITCVAVIDVHRTFHCGAKFMICEEHIHCIDFNVFVHFLSLHSWLLCMLSLSMVVGQCPICRHGCSQSVVHWDCLTFPGIIIPCSSSAVLDVHSVHFPFYDILVYAIRFSCM